VTVPTQESPSTGSFTGFYAVAALAAVILLAFGGYDASHGRGHAMLIFGAAALLLVMCTWPVAMSIAASRRASEAERAVLGTNINQKLTEISAILTVISEQQLLSDRAKSVAFREKDREALRKAIREEMAAKDWDAALVLANGMEREFGYAQEAAALRTEINNNRSEVMQKHIGEAATSVEQHTRAERWSQAVREADQIQQMYPNDPRAKQLSVDIETRRQAHKRQLMDSWKEAVNRKDVDGSIEVLKRLDLYLTPPEAEAMQETARGIFKEKLNILKDQFSAAVQGHRWAEAIKIGDTIIHDFPNSRIALEVRDTMEPLRKRAAAPAEVAKV
jgi:hypothetical protein